MQRFSADLGQMCDCFWIWSWSGVLEGLKPCEGAGQPGPGALGVQASLVLGL